jgi:hypothetical protein
MSAIRKALRSVLDRIAGTLSLNERLRSAEEVGVGLAGAKEPEPGPCSTGRADDDLLDRERQLRVLMLNWM